MSALDKQVGGDHYKNYQIQPVEFITRNNLGFLEGCVIKRLCRWQMKDGIKDLRKAIHEIELLIEAQEVEEKRAAEARQEKDDKRNAFIRGTLNALDNRDAPPIGSTHAAPKLRQCTCQGSLYETPPMCNCPPGGGVGTVRKLPAANSYIPPYACPEGADWPPQAENGTRILVWRPRKAGDTGAALYGWVEIGFMWDGDLVPHEAAG